MTVTLRKLVLFYIELNLDKYQNEIDLLNYMIYSYF